MSEEGVQPGRFPDPVMAPEGQEAAGRGAGLAAGGGEGQGRAQARPAHPAFSTPESPTLHCVPLVSVTVQGERGALGGGGVLTKSSGRRDPGSCGRSVPGAALFGT